MNNLMHNLEFGLVGSSDMQPGGRKAHVHQASVLHRPVVSLLLALHHMHRRSPCLLNFSRLLRAYADCCNAATTVPYVAFCTPQRTAKPSSSLSTVGHRHGTAAMSCFRGDAITLGFQDLGHRHWSYAIVRPVSPQLDYEMLAPGT